MNNLLTILAFLICLNSFGQDPNSLKSRLELLETKVNFKVDSTGISKIQLPSYNCATDQSKYNWHVQDLNNDGLQDLIYSGACEPYEQTGVFLNSPKGFELIYDYPGKVLSIAKIADGVHINILKSSCCCDYISELIELTITDTSAPKKQTISFHTDTHIKTANKFYEKTVSGILRSAPIEEDAVKKDPCTGEKIIGNQLATLTNEVILVINKEKNWLLVIQQNEGKSKLGWISE